MLDFFLEITNYNRKYASFQLQDWVKKRVVHIGGELVEIEVGSLQKRKRKAERRSTETGKR
jgi:hypothetical protein